MYLYSFYLLIQKFNLLHYISSFGFHFNQDKITQINYFIQYFHRHLLILKASHRHWSFGITAFHSPNL